MTRVHKGLIVGAVALVGVWAMIGPVLQALVIGSKHRARRAACAHNLKQLGTAMHAYAVDYGDHFPDKLSRLYPSYVSHLAVFCCPATFCDVSPRDIDANTNYSYVPGLTRTDPPHTLVMFDRSGFHNGRRSQLLVDGQVEWSNRR